MMEHSFLMTNGNFLSLAKRISYGIRKLIEHFGLQDYHSMITAKK